MKEFYMVYNADDRELVRIDPLAMIGNDSYRGRKVLAQAAAKSKAIENPEKMFYVLRATEAFYLPTPPQVENEELEGPTKYRLIIRGIDPTYKIATIKAIRSITDFGLRDAKEIADQICFLQESTLQFQGSEITIIDEDNVDDVHNLFASVCANFELIPV